MLPGKAPSGVVAASPILVAEALSKSYGRHVALRHGDFSVMPGEFLVLVGPSGSGKSTLLRLIGGFERPDSGRVLIDGIDVTSAPPASRPTSMVFQRLALFPHMTVADNITFPLRLKRADRAVVADRLAEMMQLMHLRSDYGRRYPSQLSGGEQQRVALARSMISSPRILLLDEPLSALDVKLRKDLQAELRALHRLLGVTFIHVTHDLEEAMILADRVCVMRDGSMVQLGSPQEIYHRPRDAFVASFIGETNLIPIHLEGRDDAMLVARSPAFDDGGVILAAEQVEPAVKQGPALLMVRPENLRLTEDTPNGAALSVSVEEIFMKGSITQYRARSRNGGIPVVFEVQGGHGPMLAIGDTTKLRFRSSDAYVVEGEAR
jgi:ABC-type Fe3+/spermidine/putrescine transport system ATPase subunit